MYQSLQKLWWLLSAAEKRNAFLLVVLLLVNGLLEMIGVGIIPLYVGILAFPEKLLDNHLVQILIAPSNGVPPQNTLLYWGTIALVGIFTLKVIYNVFIAHWQGRFVNSVISRLGDQLFSSYMEAPYIFHLQRNSALLLRNVSTECMQLGYNVLNSCVEFVTHLFIFLAVLGLLIIVSPGYAQFSLLIFAIVASLLVGTLHQKFKNLGIKAQSARADVVCNVNEGLGGVKEIKMLHRERYFIDRFCRSFLVTLDVQRFMQIVSRGIPFVMEWISVIALLAVVFTLFSIGKSADAILSIVVLFAVSLVRLKSSITSLFGRYSNLQHSLPSLNVVYDDLQTLQARQHTVSVDEASASHLYRDIASHPVTYVMSCIELEGVSFKYPNSQDYALRDISLTVNKGDAIGFVGSTGAGKSTLIDVILGVLVASEGQILVDGKSIYSDIDMWQKNIGYIPQSTYLVDGSIKANIALGLPESKIEQTLIKRALKVAHLDHFVDGLPLGVETIVGERGVRLSGGQRQRVAIARALYHDPEILVMDEATSALDNVTERSVIKAVDELKGDRTILMIAHRLSTVRNCDRIVLLEKGRIQAIGSYEELLRKNEGFRKMVEA